MIPPDIRFAMSESSDKRGWLLLIAIGALLVLLWGNGPNMFHFHWNIPLWPTVIVAFAIWWMAGGNDRQACCGGTGTCCEAESMEPNMPSDDASRGAGEAQA